MHGFIVHSFFDYRSDKYYAFYKNYNIKNFFAKRKKIYLIDNQKKLRVDYPYTIYNKDIQSVNSGLRPFLEAYAINLRVLLRLVKEYSAKHPEEATEVNLTLEWIKFTYYIVCAAHKAVIT